jgi:hypothetical protein
MPPRMASEGPYFARSETKKTSLSPSGIHEQTWAPCSFIERELELDCRAAEGKHTHRHCGVSHGEYARLHCAHINVEARIRSECIFMM